MFSLCSGVRALISSQEPDICRYPVIPQFKLPPLRLKLKQKQNQKKKKSTLCHGIVVGSDRFCLLLASFFTPCPDLSSARKAHCWLPVSHLQDKASSSFRSYLKPPSSRDEVSPHNLLQWECLSHLGML